MNLSKISNMQIAKKYGKEYWDGDRKYGYGGYKYINNYNKSTVKALIKKYNLNRNEKVLDIGCGKAYLLYDLYNYNKNLKVYGLDISKYAKIKSLIPNKKNYLIFDLNKKKSLPYKDNFFDLVICSGTLHNLSLNAIIFNLNEINRISKKSIIMVESFRNDKELFNLQCWALTCQSFLHTKDWNYLIKTYSPNSYLEFIFFK